MKIRKGIQKKARRMLIYGENGIGKSTLAANFPKPIILNFEDGVNDIGCDHTERFRSYEELQEFLVRDLAETDYRTIVLDTADWLEKLLGEFIARKNGKDTIDDIPFGRGYKLLEKAWKDLLTHLEFYWGQNRHIVFTCHEFLDRFADPEGDTYNFYRPSLHKTGSGCVTEWCDEVLFCKHKKFLRKREEGFNQERHIPIATGERVIVCNKQPAIEAKNRLGLPDEIPMKIESFFEPLRGIELNITTRDIPVVEDVAEAITF